MRLTMITNFMPYIIHKHIVYKIMTIKIIEFKLGIIRVINNNKRHSVIGNSLLESIT